MSVCVPWSLVLRTDRIGLLEQSSLWNQMYNFCHGLEDTQSQDVQRLSRRE